MKMGRRRINKGIAQCEQHDFYCLNCGKRNIPIMRPRGHMRGKGHLKAMYCPYCKKEVNQFECYDEGDVRDFLKKFEAGEFIEQAEESMKFLNEKRV